MTFKIIIVLLLSVFRLCHTVTNKQYASIPEVFYYDNYDNCLLREDEALFCAFTYVLEPVDKENPSEAWNIIRNLSRVEANYRHDHLRHFICVPKTCPGVNKSDENDPLFIRALEECYNEKFTKEQLKGTITEIYCDTQQIKHPVDWIDKICGIFLVAYIVFVFYATFYEGTTGFKSSTDYRKLTGTPKGSILTAFSISKNWIRLNTVKDTPEIAKFRGIQAIRFYNSAVVIMAHTLLSFLVIPLSNTTYSETLHEKTASVFFGGGHLCLSAFFFLSSFLLSNGLFTYMKDKKGLSLKTILEIFLHRVFRLMPTLLFVVLLHATWLRHLGEGPIWSNLLNTEFKNCRKNGWTNLLYINNIVDRDNMCVPSTWYMAVSMQYFILSLFFISMLKKYEKNVWYILGAAISVNIFGTFLHNYYYDFPALMTSNVEGYFGFIKFMASPQFQYQIGSFVGNWSGEICGIAFGYYFTKRQTEKPDEKIFNSKVRIFIFWSLIALAPLCLIVPGIVIFCYSNVHNAFWASVYVALSRPLCNVALGTLILGLSEKLGGLVLRICHWPPMYVLGRLTYSSYLVHMSIVLLRAAHLRYPAYLSPYTLLTTFFGDMMVVYLAATVLTLAIELPTSALQKIIFVPKEKEGKNFAKNNIKEE